MASTRLCSIPNCGKPAVNIRGWCGKHYTRWRRHGDPLKTQRYEGALCSFEGCTRPAVSNKLCSMHNLRRRRHGDPAIGASKEGRARAFLIEVVMNYTGDDCLKWPFGRGSHGHGDIWWGGKKRVASNLVCELRHGPAPHPDLQAAHSCGNGHLGCVNPKHLRWATRSENAIEAVEHGALPRGERVYGAKLTEADVLKIRRMAGTMTHKSIANIFGVTRCHVTDIVNRKRWAWLT